MKKIVIVVLILLMICILIVSCQKKGNIDNKNLNNGVNNSTIQYINNNITPIPYTPAPRIEVVENTGEIQINNSYDVAKGMEEVKKNTRLNQLEKVLPDGKIDFSDLSGVTYEYAGEVKEDQITEVWIIKMQDSGQYNEIMNKLNLRLEALKKEYKANDAITSLLKDNDNVIIRERNGIIIAVFAGDAGIIANAIEQTLK